LKESEQQLIELNATKDKFFSIIAHDLKSPLSGILNLTGLLVREFDKISIEQMLEISEKLYKTSISFNKLLENLLLWSRISRETVDFDPQKFRLIDFPQEVVQLLNSSIKEKSLDVRIDIPENVFIFVDMNMIDTVFRNLISNSIKFTPRNGKITVTSKIIKNESVEIKIIDNGIGIKPENLNKIFRIDDKLTTRGTAGESGTGLGLIICKEFIQKHNGEIRIESELDRGTIVIFTLPHKI
jgi:signal transduction histidine kinase